MLTVQRKLCVCSCVCSKEGGVFALMHLLRVSKLTHLFRLFSPSLFLSPFPPVHVLSVCLVSLFVFLSPMHSFISLIFATEGSHSRQASMIPPLSPLSVFFPSSISRILAVTPPSQLQFSALSPLVALPVSGIGSRWVF